MGICSLQSVSRTCLKLQTGKYIAPQAIEAKLVVDRYIDQISIIADERKFVSALIIPEYKLVKEYAAKKGIRYESMEELLQKPEIIDLFRRAELIHCSSSLHIMNRSRGLPCCPILSVWNVVS